MGHRLSETYRVECVIGHADQIKIQRGPLIDKINAFRCRLTVLNIERMKGDSHQKLEHWRDECHKTIDQFFEQKCQELDKHVNEKMAKQQTEFQQIQSKINELINEDTVTLETSNVRRFDSLGPRLNKVEVFSVYTGKNKTDRPIQSLNCDVNFSS